MAQKRYKLTTAGHGLAQAGVYRFRVAFYREEEDGATHLCKAKRCPTIAMGLSDVIGTENVMAQMSIENSIHRGQVRRNGNSKIPPGSVIFEDVTQTTGPEQVDLDLDAKYFNLA